MYQLEVARQPDGRFVALVSLTLRMEETTPGTMMTGVSGGEEVAWRVVMGTSRRKRKCSITCIVNKQKN